MRNMSHGLDLNKNTLSLVTMGDLSGGQLEDFQHREYSRPLILTYRRREMLTNLAIQTGRLLLRSGIWQNSHA